MKRTILLSIALIFLFSLGVNAQVSRFVGNWRNVDNNTRGITKMQIGLSANRPYIRSWGQCSPQDCDWGRKIANPYNAGPDNNVAVALMTTYTSSIARRTVILKRLRNNQMQAQVLTNYSDSRRDRYNVYTFRKVGGSTGTLQVPVILTPRQNQRFTHFPRRTTVAWRAVSGAQKYLVEVQYYDRGVRRWITDYKTERVTGTGYRFNFVGDQPGRVRVAAIRGNRIGRKSAWRNFSFRTSSAILRAPVLINPRANSVFSIFPRDTRVNWRPVSGAVTYKVEVQYYDRSSRRWVANYKTKELEGTSWSFKFVGAQPGRVRVQAIGPGRKMGRKSGWRTFRYTR